MNLLTTLNLPVGVRLTLYKKLLPILLLFFIPFGLMASSIVPPPICSNIGGTEIGGHVFDDINYDGLLNGEAGISGITVTIFDGNGTQVASTTTDANGDFMFLSLAAGQTYRVEFTIPTALGAYVPTPAGTDNQSAVQFLTPGSCAVLGLSNGTNYCEPNPLIITTCYTHGLGSGEPAIVTNRYSLDGTNTYPCGDLEVGATYGLAYQKNTETLFTGAFVRSKVGLGPEGIDAIYIVDPMSGCFKDNAFTHFNLSDFGCDAGTAAPLCSTNPLDDPTCRDLVSDPLVASYDTWGWNNQFKTGIGDIDISDDGNTLYVMNLEGNGELVIIDVTNPLAPALINKVAIPNPGCSADSDVRPFATKVYNGETYVGITCSAESSQLRSDLKAYVYKLNAAGNGFTQVNIDGSTSGVGATDHIRLDYDRSPAFNGSGFASGDFQPWTDDPTEYDLIVNYFTRPMPLLTDIEFDNNGDMILAFANRDAYTVGVIDFIPGDPVGFSQGEPLVAGELLRVCSNGGSFVLEGGTVCPSNQSGPNNLGPGGGEFYGGDFAAGIHFETTMGALAMLPGSDSILMTVMDPRNTLNTGGLILLSNITGDKNLSSSAPGSGLILYDNTPGEFSKGSGLGDVEVLCGLPPIQVGNYVWFDTDKDGVQDPNELPAVGFTVKLYSKPASGNPVLLQTTTTAMDGSYYFWVDTNTDYFIVFCGDSNVGNLITFNGVDYNATTANTATGSNADAIDSDATLFMINGVEIPAICISSGSVTNHTYDFGLIEAANAVIGGFTFIDCNENGIQDAGDSPLTNVSVTISGPTNSSTFTDVDGLYEFIDLPPGSYTLVFTSPISGLAFSPMDVGGDDDLDSDVDASGNVTVLVSPGDTLDNVDAGFIDVEPPVFLIEPMDLTVECDGNGNLDDLNDWLANNAGAVATDNLSDNIDLVFTNDFTSLSDDCGATGSATVTFTVTDECSNSASTSATFTIVDTTNPNLVIPPNLTIECDESTAPDNTGEATATDDCSTSVEITFSDVSNQGEGCSAYNYTIERTWVATDDCENTSTAVQIITVEDTTAPEITCPSDNATLTCFETVPSPWTNAADFVNAGGTINDNCSTSLSEFTVFATNMDNGGSNCPGDPRIVVRTYYVQDACGNTATCEQVFTYLPSTEGPVITEVLPNCPKYCGELIDATESDITYTTDCSFGATVEITGPVIIGQENCPGTIYRYTYTVTDDCGRSTSATGDFFIGNEAPTITCPPFNLLLECGDPNNEQYIDSHIGIVTVNTSCAVDYTLDYFPQNFNNIACASSTVVTFIATDACGRTASCTTTISVLDNTPPVFTEIPPSVCDVIACEADADYWFNHWIDYMIGGLEAEDACDSDVSIVAVNPQLDFDCGSETVVTFVATDNCGNETEITGTFVIEEEDVPILPSSSLVGRIFNEAGEFVEHVSVSLSSSNGYLDQDSTTVEGEYRFDGLSTDEAYTVSPILNENYLNGISSMDLVLMTKHILGLQSIASPYSLIAADVDNSGTISTFDIIELRKLILHIDEAFDENTSWRFVAVDYVFPSATNPFANLFPEEIQINELVEGAFYDFVGVKIGDINGTATANGLLEGEDRDFEGDLFFQVNDKDLVAGQTYEVPVYASNFTEIAAYQFSLNFDRELVQFESVRPDSLTNLSAGNFGLTKLDEGVITTSWHHNNEVTVMDKTPLFTLRFTALEDGLLSDALSLNSRYTIAEAYGKIPETNTLELLNVDFRFDGSGLAAKSYILHQNTPNPFHQQTTIGFNLPVATQAALNVYNLKGELVYQVEGDYEKGYHQVDIDKNDLGATGLFYYRLVTPKWNKTMKMTLIKW